MNFIKQNKFLCISLGIIILITLIIIIGIINLLREDDGNYGTRLTDETQIGNDIISLSEYELIDKSLIKDFTYHKSGLILNFIVTVKNTEMDNLNKIGDTIVSKFTEEQKNVYDFQIFVKKENGETVAIGYKMKNKQDFSWINR